MKRQHSELKQAKKTRIPSSTTLKKDAKNATNEDIDAQLQNSNGSWDKSSFKSVAELKDVRKVKSIYARVTVGARKLSSDSDGVDDEYDSSDIDDGQCH